MERKDEVRRTRGLPFGVKEKKSFVESKPFGLANIDKALNRAPDKADALMIDFLIFKYVVRSFKSDCLDCVGLNSGVGS